MHRLHPRHDLADNGRRRVIEAGGKLVHRYLSSIRQTLNASPDHIPREVGVPSAWPRTVWCGEHPAKQAASQISPRRRCRHLDEQPRANGMVDRFARRRHPALAFLSCRAILAFARPAPVDVSAAAAPSAAPEARSRAMLARAMSRPDTVPTGGRPACSRA